MTTPANKKAFKVSRILAASLLPISALIPALCGTYTVSTVADLKHRLENAQSNDIIKVDGNGGNNGVYTYTSSKYNIYTLDGEINISTNYLLHDADNVTIQALNASKKPIFKGTATDSGYVFYGQSVNGLTLKNIEFELGYKGVIIDRSNHVTMDGIKVSEIGQEAIHMRDGSDHFELKYSTISETGLDRPDRGEAIYLCNDRKMWNPAYQPSPVEEDKLQNCDYAYIHHNTIGPNIGNNSVDVKEGTVGAYIANNTFLLAWTRSELKNSNEDYHPDTAIHFKGAEGVATNNTFNFKDAPSSMYRAVSVDMQLDKDPALANIHGFNNWAVNNTATNAGSGIYVFHAKSDGGATHGCNTGAPDFQPGVNNTIDRAYVTVTGSGCTPPAAPNGDNPDAGGPSTEVPEVPETVAGYTGSHNLPGKIEAENYASAPVEKTAGNANSANVTQCTYYGLDVDVQNSSDDSTCNVGWTSGGEKLNYKVGSAGGTYNITLRAATNSGSRQVKVRVNGTLVGTKTITNNGWSGWNNHTITGVSIPSNATVQVEFVQGGVNLNYLNITAASTEPETPVVPETPTQGCLGTKSVNWNTKTEIDLNSTNCISFSNDLGNEQMQAWDSDSNTSCNFRGVIESTTNSAVSETISSNYQVLSSLSGKTFKLTPSNGCKFIKVRAY